jgi:hypothetical protein
MPIMNGVYICTQLESLELDRNYTFMIKLCIRKSITIQSKKIKMCGLRIRLAVLTRNLGIFKLTFPASIFEL